MSVRFFFAKSMTQNAFHSEVVTSFRFEIIVHISRRTEGIHLQLAAAMQEEDSAMDTLQ